jgi:hypothetical protein
MIHGAFSLIRRTTAPDKSVATASAPVVGSVRSEITKKQSMVGDGRKLPNATRPLSPGRASKTRPAARPTR